MSFRKRSVVIDGEGSRSSRFASPNQSTPGSPSASASASPAPANPHTRSSLIIPGIRPSVLDGRLTTSTGIRSLDALLLYAGLALGNSLLVEENGTSEFGKPLLRYYAAEGVVQGHQVHVVGENYTWAKDLPGLASTNEKGATKDSGGKMKIAWRYERLGGFGADARGRNPAPASNESSASNIFCHDFDLARRLTLPSPSSIKYYPMPKSNSPDFITPDPTKSPYTAFLQSFSSQLANMPPNTIHRLIIPDLLSLHPDYYPPHASRPEHVLQFMHALRALLRKYPTQLTALITFPLSLHPRSTGLTRWIELLSDGILELAPFPAKATETPSAAATSKEEPPQGMLKIHRLPVIHEKGGGGGESSGLVDDMAFSLSRRKGFVIKPFSLPPQEGDTEAQQGGLETEHGKVAKSDLEF